MAFAVLLLNAADGSKESHPRESLGRSIDVRSPPGIEASDRLSAGSLASLKAKGASRRH
jgi:hypothetical protein